MKLDCVIAARNNKTIYRDGDRAVKVFQEGYPKSDVLNEALNQAKIEEAGLRIPKVLGVTMIDGKWAIISEFVEGKTLAELMAEAPEKKAAYMALLVELQMSVHQKTAPTLNKLKDKMNTKIAACDLDATTRYYLHTRLETMSKKNVICHGDFNPSNVLITEDGTPYILDWSHAAQGDAAADAARTYLLFSLSGDSADAELYLDVYCEKSGTEKKSVQSWIPFVAAAQSVKGDEKDHAFLMHCFGMPE